MSWQATAYVSELTTTSSAERLTRSEKLLALLLAKRHNPDYDIAWPSVARLADEAMMSVRMVQYALKSLQKKGVITIECRWIGPSQCDTNVYRFPGLPSRGGGATVAPGRMSSPAIRLHQGGAETLHQGGAMIVAPEPAVNRQITDSPGSSTEAIETWEEAWKRNYDALYSR
ncbi:MAG: helix-turn-helix domain-containing protein [Candidatus Tectomicrobia bacterium]|nr:helix-turn-helix domain-containing protein [Candidatus Tectomicrobia bacterium]